MMVSLQKRNNIHDFDTNKKALAAGESAGLFDYHRVMELI